MAHAQTNGALPKNFFNQKGELQRPVSVFRDFVSNAPGSRFPAEANRYHLYVSYACPWAHRTLIIRKLKGLEALIPVTVVHYHMSTTGDSLGWKFVTEDDPEAAPEEDVTPDPLHPNFKHIRELYYLADPDYSGRFTVPVLWDKIQNTIVSNESSEIIRMFNSEFNDLLPSEFAQLDLYPEFLRPKIESVNSWHYDTINNGVYKCGLARTQSAYHTAVTALFNSLDRIEAHLSQSPGPYYFGTRLTEIDIRLYVTLVRFDPVYVSLFKTNKGMIRYNYPHIHTYLRRLYWEHPEFNSTTNMKHIKHHYFESLVMLNPMGVVPDGPVPAIMPLE